MATKIKKKKISIPAGKTRKTFGLSPEVVEYIDRKAAEENRSDSNFVDTLILREIESEVR